MGRMFRIITESSAEYPNGSPAAIAISESEPYVTNGAPFIEVGGPNGPVHSLPKPAPRVIVQAPTPTPTPPAPKPVSEPYLAVAFHQISTTTPETARSAVAPEIVAYHHPDHAASKGYVALRDEITRQIDTHLPRVVNFTSNCPDNGTTTVLLNLAVTLATDPSLRVLVIEANFDHPRAAQDFGLTNIPGLSEVLAKEMPLAWALQPTPIPRLQILAAGHSTASTAIAFTEDFPKLIGQLRQWFDWILVDSGVWGERPHRDSTAPVYDGIYLITRESEQESGDMQSLRSRIMKQGGLLRGYITTRN